MAASLPAAPGHGASLRDKLPPLGTLGPFIALLAACAFFASQSDRSNAWRVGGTPIATRPAAASSASRAE